MATTLYLKDGSRETVFNDKRLFLENLLREKLGEDVAMCFNDCIGEYEKQAELEHAAAIDYELSADGWHSMCNDALENFESILEMLHAPRINKKKLRETVQCGYDNIYKNM